MVKEKTRQELLDKIEELRRTLDATTDGLWAWNFRTNQMSFSPSYYLMLGYEPDEFPATIESWQDLLHPDDYENAIREAGTKLANKIEQFRNQFRLRTKDGDYRWISARTKVVERDEHGYPILIVGNHEDITDRIEAEKTLEQSFQALTTVMDSLDAHVYVADMENFEILFMNENMQQGFGGDLTGQICYQAFRGEDSPCEHCSNPLLLDEDGEPAEVHIWEGQNPLTKRFYINRDRAIRWHDGRLVRVQIATDITERKQIEQVLKDEEARYRSLFTESPIVLWEEDFSDVKEYIERLRSQGVVDWRAYFNDNPQSLQECLQRVKILNVNMTALDFYEAGSVEELLSGLDSIFTEESFEIFRRELIAFAEGQTLYENEVQTITLTGKPLFVWVRVTIPKGYEDTWGKVFVSELDITEMKKAEDTLKRRTKEMSALHAVTLDLTNPSELEPVLQSIIARAVDLLEGSSGGLYWCDAEKRQVRCVVSYKTERDFSGMVLKYGEGAAGTVAESGQPLIIDDYRSWEGCAQVYDKECSFQAVISVPVIWQNQIQGVLNLMRNVEDSKFSQADLDLLMTLANHVAIAIENARLLQHIQRHADGLEVRVADRTSELRTMVNAMAGREVRMADLKETIKKLRRQIESEGLTPIADDPLNEPLP